MFRRGFDLLTSNIIFLPNKIPNVDLRIYFSSKFPFTIYIRAIYTRISLQHVRVRVFTFIPWIFIEFDPTTSKPADNVRSVARNRYAVAIELFFFFFPFFPFYTRQSAPIQVYPSIMGSPIGPINDRYFTATRQRVIGSWYGGRIYRRIVAQTTRSPCIIRAGGGGKARGFPRRGLSRRSTSALSFRRRENRLIYWFRLIIIVSSDCYLSLISTFSF